MKEQIANPVQPEKNRLQALLAKIENESQGSQKKKQLEYQELMRELLAKVPDKVFTAEDVEEKMRLLLAFIKADKFIEKNRIDPKTFVFNKDEKRTRMEMIDRDESKAVGLEKNFKKKNSAESKMYGTVLEAIVSKYSGQGWLAENSRAFNTCRYDDFVNGVDVIIENRQNEHKHHLGLAIDATFSSQLDKKFLSIKNGLKNGDLSQVKYFKTDNMQGRLLNLPKAVVGVHFSQLKELIGLWVDDNDKELISHPVQLQILDEIVMEFKAFAEYARQDLDNGKLADKYEEAMKVMEKIFESKKRALGADYECKDPVYLKIKNILADFNKD